MTNTNRFRSLADWSATIEYLGKTTIIFFEAYDIRHARKVARSMVAPGVKILEVGIA